MTTGRARARSAALWSIVVAAATGCAATGTVESGPMVDRIDDAIFAVETHYRAPQDYFEISATADRVSLIVAVEGASAAEQAYWSPGGGLVGPEPVGPATGATFRGRDLDFDPGRVLTRVAEELPDSEIIDFAVTGGGGDRVVYDATVLSGQTADTAERGTLLVLLAGDGAILGVRAS